MNLYPTEFYCIRNQITYLGMNHCVKGALSNVTQPQFRKRKPI